MNKKNKTRERGHPVRISMVFAQVSVVTLALLFVLSFLSHPANSQTRKPAATSVSLIIQSEPNAIVWIDEVRRGVTDVTGKLALTSMKAGRHVLRVRANGFKEVTQPLLPGRRAVVVRLVRTSEEAELSFQQAEEAREKAKDDESRKQAAELYRRALKIRPAFPAAHVGLARVLMDQNKYEDALAEIETARSSRPVYPESSAVEGRIYREMAFADEATKSFRRAIREGKGFQPEAHVGLARVFEDRGQYEEAASEFAIAIKQLSDSEPVIYQMLGAVYEKLEKYKEAVAAYEQYLKLAPNGSLAPAVRSIIDQLHRQAAGQELRP
jgi:tetratricopeptide (TPR) repeat protein